MNKEIRNKLILILILGLLIRFIVAPYVHLSSLWEKLGNLDELFIAGNNPFMRDPGWGPSFYIFYIPVYLLYGICNHFGLYFPVLLDYLYKFPAIIGDIIVFYSLFEITYMISKDKKRSLMVATVYFLNPYPIWVMMTGAAESLTVGFLLLSVLNLFKKKVTHSAVFLSISTFFRWLPFFLLPYYIGYLWRKSESFPSNILRFLASFFASASILAIPYFPMLAVITKPAYIFSWAWGGGPALIHFKYNFTGFLAALGIKISLFATPFTFLAIHIIVVISVLVHARLRQKPLSAESVMRYITVFFPLFYISVTMCQHHYIMWVFPFLLLGSMVFYSLPWYLPHVVWVSNLALNPVIPCYWIYLFELSFPEWFSRQARPFLNIPLMQSVSVIHGLFLLLTIIWSLSLYRVYKPRRSNVIGALPWYVSSFLILSFSAYCFLEILRVAYGYVAPYTSLFFIALFLLVALEYCLNGKELSKCEPLYLTRLSKALSVLYLMNLLTIFFIVIILQLDIPIFLLVQMLFLGGLWLLNKRSRIGLSIQRISLVFTPIYIAYVLVTSRNMILGSATLCFFALWLCLLIIMETVSTRKEVEMQCASK